MPTAARIPATMLAISAKPQTLDDVMAADLTTEQLSKNITSSLTTFIRSPQVTVIVANPSSSDFQRRVRITGAVTNPQSIPYREGMTVPAGAKS